MSWAALLALAAGGYALKAIGPLVLGDRELPATADRLLALIAVPLLAALIVVQTLSAKDGGIVLDARVPALAVAAVLVWRRAPFIVTVLSAAAVAAALRAVG